MGDYRVEKDFLGEVNIPKNAYYGVHTQRASENFKISGSTLPMDMFYAITEIKIAAAKANHDLGYLNESKMEAIVSAGHEILNGKFDREFIIDAFQAGAGTPTHMNVNEVMANRAIELLGYEKGDYSVVHPNDDVNRGQSTNDVVPCALRIVSVKKMQGLFDAMWGLYSSLEKKADEFSHALKSARTHMQDAVPITLGQEFGAYAQSIKVRHGSLEDLIPRLTYSNIGKNAVGTGINTKPEFTRLILTYLNQMDGILWKEAEKPVYNTQNHTIFQDVSAGLRSLSTDLGKIASDLILLNSGPKTGLNEIVLPAVEAGSSIMPGKVNPNIAEMMLMVCSQVYGNDQAISHAVNYGQLDLNIMAPVEARNLIESFDILTNGIKTFDELCIRGITANYDVLQANFERSAGLATLLTPEIGYSKAAEIVRESLNTGESIIDLVVDAGLMEREEVIGIIETAKKN